MEKKPVRQDPKNIYPSTPDNVERLYADGNFDIFPVNEVYGEVYNLNDLDFKKRNFENTNTVVSDFITKIIGNLVSKYSPSDKVHLKNLAGNIPQNYSKSQILYLQKLFGKDWKYQPLQETKTNPEQQFFSPQALAESMYPELNLFTISDFPILVVSDKLFELSYPNSSKCLGIHQKTKQGNHYIVLPDRIFKQMDLYHSTLQHEILHAIQEISEKKSKTESVSVEILQKIFLHKPLLNGQVLPVLKLLKEEKGLVGNFKHEVEAYFTDFYRERRGFSRPSQKFFASLSKHDIEKLFNLRNTASSVNLAKTKNLMHYFYEFIDLMSMNDFIELIKSDDFRNSKSLEDLTQCFKYNYFRVSLNKLKRS